VIRAHSKRNASSSSRSAPGTEFNLMEDFGTSVPSRGLLTLKDAEPAFNNQRDLLAAILGLNTFIPSARLLHVKLISNSQVSLAVLKNLISRSPLIMALLRILRKF
jgi:hypothetical protein